MQFTEKTPARDGVYSQATQGIKISDLILKLSWPSFINLKEFVPWNLRNPLPLALAPTFKVSLLSLKFTLQ